MQAKGVLLVDTVELPSDQRIGIGVRIVEIHLVSVGRCRHQHVAGRIDHRPGGLYSFDTKTFDGDVSHAPVI